MALPKRKHSTQRQGKRRASIALREISPSFCPQCHQKTLPHRICPNCGQYKGRQVINLKISKKSKKQ